MSVILAMRKRMDREHKARKAKDGRCTELAGLREDQQHGDESLSLRRTP